MALLIPSTAGTLRKYGGRHRDLDLVQGLASELSAGYEVDGIPLHSVRNSHAVLTDFQASGQQQLQFPVACTYRINDKILAALADNLTEKDSS